MIRRPLWPVFLCKLCPFRPLEGSLAWGPSLLFGMSGTLEGPPWLGSYSSLAHQSLKGEPWVGSYSVVQCIRHCRASLSIVQLPMLACGEREAMVTALPPTRDSAVLPCFRGCLAFLHRYFPPQSPPSHPLDLSLHSPKQPSPWDCSTIPKLHLPAGVPSRGPVPLSRVCIAAVRTI